MIVTTHAPDGFPRLVMQGLDEWVSQSRSFDRPCFDRKPLRIRNAHCLRVQETLPVVALNEITKLKGCKDGHREVLQLQQVFIA